MLNLAQQKFIAPYDIIAVKCTLANRDSEYRPEERDEYWEVNSAERGSILNYPKGALVASPSGPGIFCYYNSELAQTFARTGEVVEFRTRKGVQLKRYLVVIIPTGTVVRWKLTNISQLNGQPLELAAKQVLVIS